MKKTKPNKRSGIIIIAAMLAVLLLISVTKKMLYLAADPQGQKDCPPLFRVSQKLPLMQTMIDASLPKNNLPWIQQGGTINDASCLDSTPVYGIVEVRSEQNIREALRVAQEQRMSISIAGVTHSMGGQAFAPGAIVLNMLKFNHTMLDTAQKTITVQSGATWHDIQNRLHPAFAVKAMQSTDIFTVGGSISVNAHGMDHHAGSVADTIRSMRVMLPDGSIQTVSRTQNAGLFELIVGGYGLFGVILDVQLEITDNAVYERERMIINYKEFPAVFTTRILPDDTLGLFYGHLSTSPGSFLKEMMLYTYRTTDAPHSDIPPLDEVENVALRRLVLNFSKKSSFAKRAKWFAEKYIEPRLENCSVSRTQAMKEGEDCLVSRNEPMHDSVHYLQNNLKEETDILQEYFVPRDQFIPYIDDMREILERNHANVLNVSVRVVQREEIFLNYAPQDMFAIVLYLNQTVDAKGNEHMGIVTRELIDLTASRGGKFFLPYQLHYTPAQLQQSYPEIVGFFALKQMYDPQSLLTNTFYQRYSPAFK